MRVGTVEILNCCQDNDEQELVFSRHDIVLRRGLSEMYKDLWMDTRLYLWFAK